MVLSCSADTSPAGVRPLWREPLQNEVKRIDETLSGNAAATHAFHRHIAAIEAELSSRRPVAARGMAIFAASERNLLQVYLPEELQSSIAGEAPHAWVGAKFRCWRRSTRSLRRLCGSGSGSSSTTSSAACVRGVVNQVEVAPQTVPRDVRRRTVQSLHRNADLDARHIEVAVADDVVTSTGTVGSWSLYEAAERGAGSAPGIRLVANQIRVVPQEPHEFGASRRDLLRRERKRTAPASVAVQQKLIRKRRWKGHFGVPTRARLGR
jgi:hypothetical protein